MTKDREKRAGNIWQKNNAGDNTHRGKHWKEKGPQGKKVLRGVCE